MTEKVEVVRYVRGKYPVIKAEGVHFEISNMHGITLIYQINWATELVSVSWSVCHGENFSRKEGKRVARLNNQNMYLTFDEIRPYDTLESAVVAFLQGYKFIKGPVTYLDVYTPLREGLNIANKHLKGL